MYDERNPEHKYPSNDAAGLPKDVSFGNSLGQWEDECGKGERIVEVVIAGAKSYAYRMDTGKVVVKQKGITLDVANHERFSFEKMKKMVLEGEQLESASRHQFGWCNTSKNIYTRYISRTATSTLESKRKLLLDGSTVPYGYSH